jgi:hypothetical protein
VERKTCQRKIDELKAELQSPSGDEVAEIFRGLSEKDSERWDKEIEADSHSGGLDFLVHEAREEKAKGSLRTYECECVVVLRIRGPAISILDAAESSKP